MKITFNLWPRKFVMWSLVIVQMKLINDSTKKNPIVQTHYKKNGIIALKKHVDANHVMLGKRFEEESNFLLRDVLEKQPAIKRPNVSNSTISEVFGAKDILKKDVVQ